MSNQWLTPRPRRLGIDTLLRLCIKMCRLLGFYTPIIKTFLKTEYHIYIDQLNAACSAFIENITDPGKPNRPG